MHVITVVNGLRMLMEIRVFTSTIKEMKFKFVSV